MRWKEQGFSSIQIEVNIVEYDIKELRKRVLKLKRKEYYRDGKKREELAKKQDETDRLKNWLW